MLSKKLKIIDIVQKLKKNTISEQEGFKELNSILNPKVEHCYLCKKNGDDENIQNTSVKYPGGLPLNTLDIEYCDNCGTILNVDW